MYACVVGIAAGVFYYMERIDCMPASSVKEDLWTLERKESKIPIHVHLWLPEGPVKAVVQIVHGMAEYIDRYADTARDLCARGFAVAGHNHRGHGKECPTNQLGYFADENGWDLLIEDIRAVAQSLKSRFPGLPRILLGHSMGSFAVREYVLRYPDDMDAVVLSGTGTYPAPVCRAGHLLASAIPKKKIAKVVDAIAFSANNKPFAPNRTPFDWLSRDEKQVDKYVADPLCGFVFTAGAYRDFFGGLLALCKTERLASLPKSLPVLFISGANDPVGKDQGVRRCAEQWQAAGVKDVTVRLYENARHELFNETNRDEVIADLAQWIDQQIARR